MTPSSAAAVLPTKRDAGLDTVLRAMYDVVSGPAGKREWLRHGELFAPDARITIVHKGQNGVRLAESFSMSEYRTSRDAYLSQHPFYETEDRREVEVRGDIAHVYSWYSCRHAPDQPAFTGGVNSIQLVHSAGRWWIVSLMWESTSIAAQLRSADARPLE